MKYNEAIDMILDGGEAYRKERPEYKYKFDGACLQQSIDEEEEGYDCHFEKNDFTATDWIVEKDGVVYYEWVPEFKRGKDELILTNKRRATVGMPPASEAIAIIKSRTHEQDEPAELEDNGQKWEEIKMPIIADEVNEEWLEKKMLCYLTKFGLLRVPENCKIEDHLTCCHKYCPFCFPEKTIIADEPAELKAGEGIKLNGYCIDLDDVKNSLGSDEWLEKKILCLMRKQAGKPIKFKGVNGSCFNADCSFCFPEPPKTDPIPQAEEMINPAKCKQCGMGMYKCNEFKLNSPPQVVYRCAKCDDGKPHKKITVEVMMKLIQDYCYEFYGDSDAENYLLSKNLTYLVSLQEK